MDCIFCKIISGNVPNYTVYENENVLAFLDIFPHAKGHTVVVPKKHIETIFDLNEQETADFFTGVKKAVEKVEVILRPNGYNIGWNQCEAGGQVVPHLHVHIFPRYQNDGGGSMHSIIKNSGDASPKDLAPLFK